MHAAIAERIQRLLASLQLPSQILEPVHLPGVFADLAAGFDCDDFERRAMAQGRLTDGRYGEPEVSGGVYYQGDTSYHAWHQDEVEHLESRQQSIANLTATTRLPLPDWALALQQELLAQVHRSDAFGWSSELFFSKTPRASLGVHADNDDVYTVQLFGEKEWRVGPTSLELLRDLLESGALFRTGPQSAWHSPPDRPKVPLREARTIHLVPGDFLITPAFALHEVTAVGAEPRSLSFNVSICREELWEKSSL